MSPKVGPERPKFELRCHAGNAGHLEVVSDAVSVTIGQQIRREGKEEFWDSLLVECKEQDDGSLTVDVVVFHPRWDEPLRIASIQSHPFDGNRAEPTGVTSNKNGCDLQPFFSSEGRSAGANDSPPFWHFFLCPGTAAVLEGLSLSVKRTHSLEVQCLAHLLEEFVPRKGFLDEQRALGQHTSMSDHVVRIA